jgi:tetratricopeptide (TPR) repeat protein
MRVSAKHLLLTGMVLACAVSLYPQTRKQAPPQIRTRDYRIQLTLNPEAHEMKAVATVTFTALERTDVAVFDINENLSVIRVSDAEGAMLDFGQDETGPGMLAVHFQQPKEASENTTIEIEYTGGFDLDRYSRNFTRDENSAYIGVDGTYLLYPAKWFPVNKLFSDRPTTRIEVTAPLGITAIGPGAPEPIVTHGLTETFGWVSAKPVTLTSVIAGRFFQRTMDLGDFTIDTYAREDHIDAIRECAQELSKILGYYRQLWGEPAAGLTCRLVEVSDKLAAQPGMLGTIFVTHQEVGAKELPVRALARRAAYQWWMETVGTSSSGDLWLADGMAYYSAALYLGQSDGPEALAAELDNLAVLGLKFESRSAVRDGINLGYGSDMYESVVAGKGAAVLNMLRGILGADNFSKLLQQYTREYASVGGSTAGFRKLAEKFYGNDLGWFFGEWIDTTGVPNLQVDYVIYKTADGFRVSGTVKQDRDIFRMPLEIQAKGEGSTERTTVEVNGKTTPFDINIFTWPDEISIDPENKLLRDSDELQLKVQLTLGNDLKEKSDYVGAVRAYEQALKIDPRKSIIHFRMAEVFFEQMNLQASANTFRDALNGDLDPPWIEVWCYVYLGKIYDILGQRQRAMAEYNKALNTKDNTNGALEEAKKWLAIPYQRDGAASGKDGR